MQQPNFLSNLAADIPQVQIPNSFHASVMHHIPVVQPMPVISRGRGQGRSRAQPPPVVPIISHSSVMPARVPAAAASDDPFAINVDTAVHVTLQPAAVGVSRAEGSSVRVEDIPQVQLPVGWDAPLANPVPQAPPPMPRAGGSRARVLGPLHDISGGNADPALSGLHRGQIAHRERQASYLADRWAQLLRQLELQQQEMEKEKERQLEKLREQEQLRINAEQEKQRLEAATRVAELERQRNEARAAEWERIRLDARAANFEREVRQRKEAAIAELERQRNEAAVAELEYQLEAAAEDARQRAVQQAMLQECQRIARLEANNQDYQRQNREMTARIMANWRQQQQMELEEDDEEERGQLQAWAAQQLAELQSRVHQEELDAQHARHLYEQLEAQMAAQANQEQQDNFAAAALAAAEYEQNNSLENQLRREEELRQQAEDEHLRQQQAVNQGQQ